MKFVILLFVWLCFGLLKLEAETIYSLKEGNSFQNFLLAEDEVYVSPQGLSSFRLLQKRLKDYWPEASLLEERDNAALVKWSSQETIEGLVLNKDLKQKLGRANLWPVLYFNKGSRTESGRRIVIGNLLVGSANFKKAKILAKEFGQPKITSTPLAGKWIFHYGNPLDALVQVKALHDRGIEAQLIMARNMSRRFSVNDKLYRKQWYLKDPFTSLDINVEPAWDNVTGNGVTIAIVDDGLETKHPDLKAHVAKKFDGLNLNLNGGRMNNPKPKKRDYHGTACAGIAAAIGNNHKGVAGVAFNARLVGIRLIAKEFTDEESATALSWQKDRISIYSNSWGPEDSGKNLEDAMPGDLTLNAIQQGIETGRTGKGCLYVWAGGNGRSMGDHSNYDGYANLRYVIAVGAYDLSREQAYYSESGANLTVVAPSSGVEKGGSITTVDLKGKRGETPVSYSNLFGGTSAAAPQVAGVIALMLERNPNLGWRDVKEILIRTANRQGLVATNGLMMVATEGNEQFVTNGGGFSFSHSYGAGRVDAAAAVSLTTTWSNLGPEITTPLLTYSNLNYVFAKTNDLVKTFSFGVTNQGINLGDSNVNLRVETVVFKVNVNGAIRSNLLFELTSPSGMKTIIPPRARDEEFNLENWTFSSVRHWGESSQGDWTLRARNLNSTPTILSTNKGVETTNTAKVVSLSLQLFGTQAAP